MFRRVLTGLVLCWVFAIIPLGEPQAGAHPVDAPHADGPSCTVAEKCMGDCGCRAGCTASCAKGMQPRCEAAYEKKGLCYDSKCYCVKGPRADSFGD